MADVADIAQRNNEVWQEAAIRAAIVTVPAGVPGRCGECGDETLRLIDGLCAPCREPAPMPRRW